MTTSDGYLLPDDLQPSKSVCFTVMVPDAPEYIQAFRAQVEMLSYWYTWERDPLHKAKVAALVWFKVWKTMLQGDCNTPCPEVVAISEEVFMPFRQVGCELQTQCTDGSWSTIFDASKCLPSDQPGNGAHQPQPGGGCQTYSGKMQANQRWLVPATVSENDTIRLVDSNGAGSDNGIAYYCPDGSIYFAGSCVPSTAGLIGTDPLPSTVHMQLIFEVDGVFYPTDGGAVTVPSGVHAAQVYLQVNDSNLSDNSGSYTVDVEVCNNQAETWCHELDFSVNTQGFVKWTGLVSGEAGAWSPGVGWEQGDFVNGAPTNNYRGVIIKRLFAATLTNVTMVFDRSGLSTDQPHSNWFTVLQDLDGAFDAHQDFDHSTDGTNLVLSWSGSAVVATGIYLEVVSSYYHPASTFNGTATIKKVTICGIGPDPFV